MPCTLIVLPADRCLVFLLFWGVLTVYSWMPSLLSYPCRQVNAENSKLVVSNRRAVLEQEMKELSRGDVVEG